jgi:predicted metal-dependent phosphoesterase TrpH
MKKIDLHIHTIPVSGKDANFVFNISKFQVYVDNLSIDAVAITNHNLFDLAQFNNILSGLQNVVIFPGIEIDFGSGHLLIIGENENLNDFNQKCALVKSDLEASGQININRLKEIFVDLDKYLVIPHYDKKPNVSLSMVESLKPQVFAGEVRSPKKFNRIIKEINDRSS